MIASLLHSAVFLCLFVAPFITAQSSTGSGYTGYSLEIKDDEDNSLVYATEDTLAPANASTTNPPPDVYLNATVDVGEINITVSNLTAKINLDAQVLNLLQFNAGVDLSIDRVELLIENVTAKVLLEARLANLVIMINDTLNSLDLNPILATLGQDVGTLVSNTTSALGAATSGTGSSNLAARSYNLAENILYSVNNYAGNTHTNRILTQSGLIVDQSLNNNGQITGQQTIGTFVQDMVFNGYNATVVIHKGLTVRELEYVYAPFPGLSIVSAIYVSSNGTVVATKVLSESGAGGSSTVGDQEVPL